MVKKIQAYWQKYGSVITWIFFIVTLVYLSWINIAKLSTDNDIRIYYSYAQEYLTNHGIPYGNFSPEYPPIAFLLFLLPRLFVNSIQAYKIFFTFIIDFALLIGGFFIFRKGKSLSLILFTIFLCSCHPYIIFQRFDVIVSIVLFASLLQFSRKEYSISIISLSIGTCLKFFPIILLPFYLLWLPNNTARLKHFSFFIFIAGLILLPFFIGGANIQNILHFIDYNKDRGIQIESSWASLLRLIPLQNNIKIVDRYGAMEISSPLTPLFTNLAFYFSIAYLVGLFFFAWKKNKQLPAIDKKSEQLFFWEISFLVSAGFIFFNKVFSPQYVLWLIPLASILICLYKPRQKIITITLFILFLFATYRIWPQNYTRLIEGQTYAINNLLFRNAILLVIILYCFKSINHHISISKLGASYAN